jgi:SAM-dependent methyltransferase
VSPRRSGPRARAGTLVAALQPWHGVAEPLHRRIVHFADPEGGAEVLWVGAGAARAAIWWAGRSGVPTSAVDPNADAVAWSERAARAAGVGRRVTLQAGRADDLPHADGVFDLVVTTCAFDCDLDPEEAVRQAARVVRPLRPVVFVVPMWFGTPAEEAEELLGAIGMRPRFLAAWKQVAREAGLVEIGAEEVPRDGRFLAEGMLGPMARAWRTAGADGARVILGGPVRLLRRLVRRRVVGLGMVRGARWPAA